MGEIKISVSENTEALLESLCNDLGIKKTEYIKSLLIESLKMEGKRGR